MIAPMRIPTEGLKIIFCACRQLEYVDFRQDDGAVDDSVVMCLAENYFDTLS